MTIGEIIAKMLTFAVLTLVAAGLLVRISWAARQPVRRTLATTPRVTVC